MKSINENDNNEVCSTQTKRILNWMRKGNTITPIEALDKFGCFRLGARIADIEKITGTRPKRKRVRVQNREGKDVYVAQYWL